MLLAHPMADTIFIHVRGGTEADHRSAARVVELPSARTLQLWSEAALALSPRDPLRWVTVAHSRLLGGDERGAVEALQAGLQLFPDHPQRYVLHQNLGLAYSFLGDVPSALDAYRCAARSPSVVDREVAAVSLCVVGSKLRTPEIVREGATLLLEVAPRNAASVLAATIRARRRRGSTPYWGFDEDDLEILRRGAPELGPMEDWRVA